MKILITGGCSFSECISGLDTWPIHLDAALSNYQHISKGMSSQGNGLISRSIIYEVSEQLKKFDSKDILVGVMWSGPDRHEFYSENPVTHKKDLWLENPTKFIPAADKNWVIMNWHWSPEYVKYYYANFSNLISSYIYTLEHILRLQWFLKIHNIRYFMSTYTGEVLPEIVKTHIDTQHLYEQLDIEQFLPVVGEHEWCRDFTDLPFVSEGNDHPSGKQHKVFTDRVIIPFLQSKNYI